MQNHLLVNYDFIHCFLFGGFILFGLLLFTGLLKINPSISSEESYTFLLSIVFTEVLDIFKSSD